MTQVDEAIYRTEARRAQQAAERDATPQAPDPVAENLALHAEQVEFTRRLAQINLGDAPTATPPAAVGPREPWDVDTGQVIFGVEISSPLSLELRRLLRQVGADNLRAGVAAITGAEPAREEAAHPGAR